MSIAIEQALQVLPAVVVGVPVGTNLALLHLMWGILNGSFLSSRGAIFPALQDRGFSPQEIRRSWQALRYGAWGIDDSMRGPMSATSKALGSNVITVESVPLLFRAEFPQVALSNGKIRKKNSVTAHLPKGIAAHRRQKNPPH